MKRFVFLTAFLIGCSSAPKNTDEPLVETTTEKPEQSIADATDAKTSATQPIEPTATSVNDVSAGADKGVHQPKVEGWGDPIDPAALTGASPEVFHVKLVTTKGNLILEIRREWAPNGSDRFYNLVRFGYFQDIAIFRSVKDFMFQFGIHGDPKMNKAFETATFPDDPVIASNDYGYISFAATGSPNSRNNQLFINLTNNARLDKMRFAPIGRVVAGLELLKSIYNTGENRGNFQGEFQAKGNKLARDTYPELDYILSAEIVTFP